MLKKIFQEKFNHWFDNTKLHGIPLLKICERQFFKKLWLICFFGFFLLNFYFIFKNFIDYFKFEVETVIEISRDTNFEFPAVSFCNFQLCGEEDLNEDFLIQSLNQSGTILSKDELLSIPLPEMIKLLRTNFVQKYNLTKNDTIKRFKKSIISCSFSSDLCSENDFEHFQLSEFQQCFKFNSKLNQKKYSRRFGKSFGLEIELFLGLQRKCFSPLPSTYGLTVYLHKAYDFVGTNAYGVQLSTGTETNIAVDRTFIYRKSKPYSNCINQNDGQRNELVAEILKNFGGYSQHTCFKICDQEFLIKNFGCYDKYLPSGKKKSYSECDFNKTEEIKKAYYDKSLNTECYKNCPKECEYVKYDLTVSSSLFPTETYSKILMKNENVSSYFDLENERFETTYKNSLTSFLSAKIYFKSDLVKNVKEKPLNNFQTFVASIGGTLGLFLGLSLISILEFIEFLFEICVIYFYKAFQKRKNKVQSFNN